jgi:hypothetical protein
MESLSNPMIMTQQSQIAGSGLNNDTNFMKEFNWICFSNVLCINTNSLK